MAYKFTVNAQLWQDEVVEAAQTYLRLSPKPNTNREERREETTAWEVLRMVATERGLWKRGLSIGALAHAIIAEHHLAQMWLTDVECSMEMANRSELLKLAGPAPQFVAPVYSG